MTDTKLQRLISTIVAVLIITALIIAVVDYMHVRSLDNRPSTIIPLPVDPGEYPVTEDDQS